MQLLIKGELRRYFVDGKDVVSVSVVGWIRGVEGEGGCCSLGGMMLRLWAIQLHEGHWGQLERLGLSDVMIQVSMVLSVHHQLVLLKF